MLRINRRYSLDLPGAPGGNPGRSKLERQYVRDILLHFSENLN